MSEEHPIEKEVEECATLKVMVRQYIVQLREKYDVFKETLNAPVASS